MPNILRKTSVDKHMDTILNQYFKNHEANLLKEEHTTTIKWEDKINNAYWVKYVLSGSNIFIDSDFGSAVYRLTEAASIENINGSDIYYLTKKLISTNESFYEFDHHQARKQLKDYKDELIMTLENDGKSIPTEINEWYMKLEELAYQVDKTSDWSELVYRTTRGFDIDHELITTFGCETSIEIVAFIVGLKLAIEQLENK